jgi:hypothetical protein
VNPSQGRILQALEGSAVRWHIVVRTPVAHCVNLELEGQQQLPEGTLAQVAPVEHIDVE